MKITLSQLRRIIKEEVALASSQPDMTLLSKIARLRPLPAAALKPAEATAVETLQKLGYVRWDLGSKGWTATQQGLDALGRW